MLIKKTFKIGNELSKMNACKLWILQFMTYLMDVILIYVPILIFYSNLEQKNMKFAQGNFTHPWFVYFCTSISVTNNYFLTVSQRYELIYIGRNFVYVFAQYVALKRIKCFTLLHFIFFIIIIQNFSRLHLQLPIILHSC